VANATVSRLGQIDQAGVDDALFLKVFAGEVLAAYETANKTEGRHHQRTITSGKSAQFPATWKASSEYHTPGAEILGDVINHAEVVVTIDGLLISPVFIAEIDEARNHYDVRSIYSNEVGIALANAKDRNVFRVMLQAARSAEIHSGLSPTGKFIENAAMKTDATVLASSIFTAHQTLDENDVPDTQTRSCFLRPAQYYLLAANKDLLNKDWGGQGSYAEAVIPQVAGVELVKTNQLPITDESAAPGVLAKYQGNWDTTAAIVSTEWACATVKLMDLRTEMAYDIRRQGTLIVAKYAMGHGKLRPECAIELRTGTPV
jgi:Major capsid protein